MRMENCPKFSRCRAPICPLDPQCLHSTHLDGEPICFYLREYVKTGSQRRFKGVPHGDAIYRAISEAYPVLVARYRSIRRRLQRAKWSTPRLGRRPGALSQSEPATQVGASAIVSTSQEAAA